MIEINFLSSPDPEILGNYKVFYDSLSIGTSRKNDLIIEDPKVLDFHVILTSSKDSLICEGAADSISFRGNDKYYKGKKTFNKKDKITIGNSVFEIVDFSLEPVTEKKLSLKDAYEKTLSGLPEQEKIIDEMENEISHLEELTLNQPSDS